MNFYMVMLDGEWPLYYSVNGWTHNKVNAHKFDSINVIRKFAKDNNIKDYAVEEVS